MKKIWSGFINLYKYIYRFVVSGKKKIEELCSFWGREKVLMPEQYYITRTGSAMREPAKKRTFFKSRYRMSKRAY